MVLNWTCTPVENSCGSVMGCDIQDIIQVLFFYLHPLTFDQCLSTPQASCGSCGCNACVFHASSDEQSSAGESPKPVKKLKIVKSKVRKLDGNGDSPMDLARQGTRNRRF